MKQRLFFTIIISLILLISLIPVAAEPVSLSYLHTSGETRTLETGRVHLIDWAASWCSICKQNQANMNAIFDQYSDEVTFLTLSYGGSRDELDDVIGLKGGYPWSFGLDNQDRASDFSVSNGYVWVLDTDLNLVKEWSYQVVSSSAMSSQLNSVLGGEGQTLQTTTDPGNNFNLADNPLAIGFFGFIVLLGAILYFRRSDTPSRTETRKVALEDKLAESKKNWDWDK